MASEEIGQFAVRNAQSRNTIFGGFHVSTGILAILSLVSYFISPDIVPGQMEMLITLYLILIKSYNSVDAPQGMKNELYHNSSYFLEKTLRKLKILTPKG